MKDRGNRIIGNRPKLRKQAIIYAQDAVRAINKHLGYDAAHIARHNQSGELASIIVECGNCDVREYPNIDDTAFSLPRAPQKLPHEKHGLFFEAYSPNRLDIW